MHCLSQSLPETPGEEFFLPLGSARQDYTKGSACQRHVRAAQRLLRLPQANGANPLLTLGDSGRSKLGGQVSELGEGRKDVDSGTAHWQGNSAFHVRECACAVCKRLSSIYIFKVKANTP